MFLIYQMTHFPMSRIRIYNFILCSKTNTTFRNVFSELRIKYSIKSCYSKIQARYNSVSGWSNIHRHVISWKSIRRCFSMILRILIIYIICVIVSVWFEEWLHKRLKRVLEKIYFEKSIFLIDMRIVKEKWFRKLSEYIVILKPRLFFYNFIYFYSEELYF